MKLKKLTNKELIVNTYEKEKNGVGCTTSLPKKTPRNTNTLQLDRFLKAFLLNKRFHYFPYLCENISGRNIISLKQRYFCFMA